MEIIWAILIIWACISYLPLRIKIREKMMKKLAGEFKLSFSTNAPSYSEYFISTFYTKSFHDKYRFINVITGNINGHTINIHDICFPSPYYYFIKYLEEPTYVEIDGQVIMGKLKSFKAGRFLWAPVY